MDDLKKGNAVYWDINRNYLIQEQKIDIPLITPDEAGRHLAQISFDQDLVIFECFLPDLIGHKKDSSRAAAFLEMLDKFLNGLSESIEKNTSIILTSDHGNMEDLSTGQHTRNPVPLLVMGPLAQCFTEAISILDLTGLIIKNMGI